MKENESFIAKCLESGWCETAYEDDEAIFLKIRAQKGDAPAAFQTFCNKTFIFLHIGKNESRAEFFTDNRRGVVGFTFGYLVNQFIEFGIFEYK